MHNAEDWFDDRIGARVWHGAYCRWYDHDRAGRTVRSAVWGWLTDRLVRFA